MAWLAKRPLGGGRKSDAWHVYWREGGKQRKEMCRTPDGQPITSKPAAVAYMAAWVKDREMGGMGLTDPNKKHLDRPAHEHLVEYIADVRAESRLPDQRHADELQRVLSIVFDVIGRMQGSVVKLRDVNPVSLNRYLNEMLKANPGISATTQNRHRQYVVSFLNWCVRTQRLASNPITPATCPKRKARTTPKGKGAFKIDELRRVLAAVKEYPVLAHSVNTGGRPRRDGTPARQANKVKLSEAERERLELRGIGRQLAYRLALATYLRRAELGRLTASMFDPDRQQLRVPGTNMKVVMEGFAVYRLPATLAADLKAYLTRAGVDGKAKLLPLPNESSWSKLHVVHLRQAGVELENEYGSKRTFHSLRTFVNLYLAKPKWQIPATDRQRFKRRHLRDTDERHYSELTDGRPMTSGRILHVLSKLDMKLITPPPAENLGQSGGPDLTSPGDPK